MTALGASGPSRRVVVLGVVSLLAHAASAGMGPFNRPGRRKVRKT